MVHKSNLESATLTDGRLLIRNVVWNLLGQVAPVLVAILTIPLLLDRLGVERFGILTLVWAIIGYFSLFDFGIGRALTMVVAEKLGRGDQHLISQVANTALIIMTVFGTIGALLIAIISPWFLGPVISGLNGMREEAIGVLYCVGFSVPIVVVTAGLRGLLEAYQRFALLNAIRVPTGILMFILPLLVTIFTKNLIVVIASLVVNRLIMLGIHWYYCKEILALDKGMARFSLINVRALLKFGSWMTVTNVLGPLMVYMDRFLIGSIVSIAAVAYYVAPYEIITKVLIIPSALIGVLFPAIASTFQKDRARAATMASSAVTYVFLILFPISLIFIVFAADGLRLWLGLDFSTNGTLVMQWLAVGVYANSIGQVMYVLVQGVGRPDVTAKLHALELPGYLVTLFVLTSSYGISGTACAWAIRVVLDAIVLGVIASRLLPKCIKRRQIMLIFSGFLVLLFFLLPVVSNPWSRVIAAMVCLFGFMFWGWKIMIDFPLRSSLKKFLCGNT